MSGGLEEILNSPLFFRAYSREIIRQCRRNYWDVEKTPLVAWI